MINKILKLLLLSFLVFSCSKKDFKSQLSSNGLVGKWESIGEFDKIYLEIKSNGKVTIEKNSIDRNSFYKFNSIEKFELNTIINPEFAGWNMFELKRFVMGVQTDYLYIYKKVDADLIKLNEITKTKGDTTYGIRNISFDKH
jgi:hypothetical protein